MNKVALITEVTNQDASFPAELLIENGSSLRESTSYGLVICSALCFYDGLV